MIVFKNESFFFIMIDKGEREYCTYRKRKPLDKLKSAKSHQNFRTIRGRKNNIMLCFGHSIEMKGFLLEKCFGFLSFLCEVRKEQAIKKSSQWDNRSR